MRDRLKEWAVEKMRLQNDNVGRRCCFIIQKLRPNCQLVEYFNFHNIKKPWTSLESMQKSLVEPIYQMCNLYFLLRGSNV